jgi:ribosome-associated protein
MVGGKRGSGYGYEWLESKGGHPDPQSLTSYPLTHILSPSMDANLLEITPDLRLPLSELEYRASRSGGPGGQHVNTSSTRVEVWWDIAGSPTLTPGQRSQLLARLRSRLDSSGRLRLVSSGSRSQLRNREDATARLRDVVAAALVVPKKRRPTRPTAAAKAARLEAKRRRSTLKQHRRPPPSDD